MPVEPSGQMRPFSADEIAQMDIRTANVRNGEHPWESREIGQSILKRAFFCKWEERYNFCTLCCGAAKLWNNNNNLSRMLPDSKFGRHPKFPNVIATKIPEIRGHGRCLGEDADGVPFYKDARVEVMYEHVDFELKTDGDTGGNERLRYVWFGGSEGGGDSVTMSGGILKFKKDPAGPDPAGRPNNIPIPYSVNVIRPTEEFSLHWEQLPFEAFGASSPALLYGQIYGRPGFVPMLGMINTVPFEGRPAGTVLFHGVSAKLTKAHDAANLQWSLEYKFLFTPYGHHKLRYFDTTDASLSGWHMVSGSVYRTPAAMLDSESIVAGARDLTNLFRF